MQLIDKTKGGTVSLIKNMSFVLPLIMGAIIALFIPETVFTDYPALAKYYGFASHWMPLIENHAQYSAFPNATRLYLSVAWVLLPFQAYAATRWIYFYKGDDYMIRNFQANKIKFLGLTPKQFFPIGIILFNVVIVTSFFFGKDPSFCNGCVNGNKVGMIIFWSLGFPISIGFVMAIQIKYFRNLKKIYF
jgi:hypothetical protein